MATDLEKLIVQLSADIKGYERELQKANGVTNRQARAIENRWRQMNRNLDGIGQNMARGLTAPLAGLGAAIGTKELIALTDAWTDLNSRVKLAAGSTEAGAVVMERIGAMARRTYSDLQQTAEGYLLNATSLKELGYDTDQTLNFVESLNNGLVISGAKGQKAATVMDAIAKAMAFGSLQGQNLNTVIQQGGRIAEALAEGLGVTTNELRRLGTEGKITSSEMFRALTSQMQRLRKEAEDMPATIGDGFTLLKNALLEYVGNADKATEVSANIAQALIVIADNFDKTADSALQLSAVIAGALVGRSIGGMIAKLGLASVALKNFLQLLAAARTMAGLATALGGLGAAAGPVGLVIGGALVGAVGLYYSATKDASRGSEEYARALKQVEDAAKKTAPAVESAGKAAAKAADEAFAGAYKKAADDLAKAFKPAMNDLEAFLAIWRGSDAAGEAQLTKIQKLMQEVAKGKAPVSELRAAIDDLGKLPAFAKIAQSLAQVVSGVDGAVEKFKELNKQLKLNELEKQFAGFSLEADHDAREKQKKKAADDFVAAAQRRNALTKDQLALEEKIAEIQKRSGAENVKKEAIEQLARDELAAEKRRELEGRKAPRDADSRFQQDIQSVRDRTAALIEEEKALDLGTAGQEQRRVALELEQSALTRLREEARQNNDANWESLELSAKQKKQIEEVAEAYGKQAEAIEIAREKQQRAQQMAAEFYETFKSGFADAITGAKSLDEALQGILKRLGDLLINAAFDSLFKPAGSGPGGVIGKMLGFAEGGPTPAGPKNKAVGIVHAGENVWSQADVARAGGMAVVEAMRRGKRGYANGGPVLRQFQAPTLPRLGAQAARQSGTHVTVGVSVDDQGNLQAYVKDVARQTAASSIRSFAGSEEFKTHAFAGSRQRSNQRWGR